MRLLVLVAWISLTQACGLFIGAGQDADTVNVGYAVALVRLENNTEELSLYVALNCDNDSIVAWLIPLPALPNVYSPEYLMVEGLSKISAPFLVSSRYGDVCSSYEETGIAPYGKDYYEVLQHETAEPQLQEAIHIETVDTLAGWLLNHGIVLPSSSENLIQYYIDKEWHYFYIALFHGLEYRTTKVGIMLRFASDEQIIPMYIARDNSVNFGYYENGNETHVYSYVIAAHKQAYELGKLMYANSLNQEEIDSVHEDLPSVGEVLENGDYVTKLEISYHQPGQTIEEDIVLDDAPDDDEYRGLVEDYSYWYYAMHPLFIVLAAFMLWRKVRIRHRPKSQ